MMAALNFMLLLYIVIFFVCIRHLTYHFASSRTFQLCGHHRSYLDVYTRHIIERTTCVLFDIKEYKGKTTSPNSVCDLQVFKAWANVIGNSREVLCIGPYYLHGRSPKSWMGSADLQLKHLQFSAIYWTSCEFKYSRQQRN